MNEEVMFDLAREAIFTVIISAGPLLLIALVVGLLISIFQTITSIQEQTLSFVPKIVAVFVGVLLFGPYIGKNVLNFLYTAIDSIELLLG